MTIARRRRPCGSPAGAPARRARSAPVRRVGHTARQGRRSLASGRAADPEQRVPARADRGRARSARAVVERRGGHAPGGAAASSISSEQRGRQRGTSSCGTSTPSSPSLTMSAGPRGQSKLTTGRPLPIASTITIPKPSQREDSANSEPAAIASPSASVRPVSVAVQPGRARARAPRARGPSRRSAAASPGGARRPARHASISRSKPFWAFSRPGRDDDAARCRRRCRRRARRAGSGIGAHARRRAARRSRARRPR